MADAATTAISGWHAVATPGRHGRRQGPAGVAVAESRPLAIATIIARRGEENSLAARLDSEFGLALPPPRRSSASPNLTLASTGPGRWLAFSHLPSPSFATDLATRLTGLATVTDQSHALALLRLSGPRVRDALAKGFPLDLHPRAFATGDVAQTVVSHITAGIRQVWDEPAYEIWVARSFAASFWHWLVASAAEYGLEVVPHSANAA
ncbi:MAG: sarcosine oxidase subunit gamma [Proteobacteria bacterium]|nr:sarcosine oxidase subunit gamma [Pseudomonadota bacterium]